MFSKQEKYYYFIIFCMIITLVFAFCSTAVSFNVKTFVANLCEKLFYLQDMMEQGGDCFSSLSLKQRSVALKRMSMV